MHEVAPWRYHGTLCSNRILSVSTLHILLDMCPRFPSARVIRAVLRQYIRLLGEVDRVYQTQEHGRKCVSDLPWEIEDRRS